jgi:hypothetical protein
LKCTDSFPDPGAGSEILKYWLKKTPVYNPLHGLVLAWRERSWVRGGMQLPPPHFIKQKALRALAREYRLKVFVETGTYYGAMVIAMLTYFDRLYSIELSPGLFALAEAYFRGHRKVVLVKGDSSRELQGIVRAINEPALFWLDGHYSGGPTARGDLDTPIMAELEHVLGDARHEHVIAIDDARLFGTEGWPSLEKVALLLKKRRPEWAMTVENDIVRMTPPCLGRGEGSG